MSGYDYSGRSYTVHSAKPVSVVSYDGHGPRTYVTRIEERVEQVRRPSTVGYVYSSARKAEKESRPREVDDFITKILDEVNGSSVTTTRWREGGGDYKFGANPRSYYEVEYVSVGSPTGSRIPRNYGDPYDLKELSRHLYDNNPSKVVYGGRDYPSDNSHVKPETRRDYEVPKTQWERSSHPSYDASPYVPPPVESRAPRTYEAYPDNRFKPDQKDYKTPDKRWVDSSSEYEHPSRKETIGGVPNNRWGNLPLKQSYDQRLPNIDRQQGEYSSVKPQSPKGYGVSDNQGGRWSSPNNDPLQRKVLGDSSKNPSNSPLKPTFDQTPSNDNMGRPSYGPQNSPSVQLQSPTVYGSPGNQRDGSTSPDFELPPRNDNMSRPSYGRPNSPSVQLQSPTIYGSPGNQRDGSTSPDFELPPRNDNMGRPSYGRQNSPSVQLQSPTVYGSPGNQRDRSTSPDFELPPRNDIMSRVPNNQWSNPPMEAPKSIGHDYDGRRSNSPAKFGSSGGYQVPNEKKGRSTSPAYEQPPRHEIVTPPKVQIPNNRWSNPPMETPKSIGHDYDNRQSNSPAKFGSSGGYQVPKDQKGRSTSPVYEHPPRHEIVTPPKVQIPEDRESPSPNGNVEGAANNRWSNIPVKTQSPRDYGAHGNQWSGPSSPVGALTNDSRPNDFRGSGQTKSPLSQTASSEVSFQPKYSVYSAPASELVTVKPRVIDSREAERRYGYLDATSDEGTHVISSRDALEKYNGYFF